MVEKQQELEGSKDFLVSVASVTFLMPFLVERTALGKEDLAKREERIYLLK